MLDFQGVITYEVDGIYPAPSLFAIHPTSGEVTVAKDLQFEAVRSDSQYKVSETEENTWTKVLEKLNVE